MHWIACAAETRAAKDLPETLKQAQANIEAMAGPDGTIPAEGSPLWWEEMAAATVPVAFTGKAVYRLVLSAGPAVRRGVALSTILRVTGHKSLGSLGHYLETSDEEVLAAITG